MLGKMLESFIFAFNAVTPMVMLIGLGYLIKQWGVFDANTERRLTKFLFNYALPCLMFINVYDMAGIRDLPFNLIGTSVAALFAVVGAGMLLAHFVAEQRNQKGVIIQMTYRSNYSVIGLSLASALYGAEGLRMGAALQAPVVILFNMLAVVFLTIYTDREGAKVDFRSILRGIVRNPLIKGLVLGVVCLAIRELLPHSADGEPVFRLSAAFPFLFTFLRNLSAAASPMMLVVLGSQINDPTEHASKRLVAIGVLMRLVGTPLIGFAVMLAFQAAGFITLTPAIIAALIAFFASPSAASSSIMVDAIGGDRALVHQYTLWSTVMSVFTLFVWCSLAHYFFFN